jgi:SagB-type dehydrogenase family enzyme
MPSDDELDIAEVFHENTGVPPFEMGLDLSGLPTPIAPDTLVARLRLPAVTPAPEMDLGAAIARRVTGRAFDPRRPLAPAVLSRLLALAGGFTRPLTDAPEPGFHRAAPSAGATHPIDVFPIVLRVAGLLPGAYRYAPHDHSLELRRQGRFGRALAAWTLHQPYVAHAGAILVLVGDLDRIRPRYGERGYRYMLLETGHIAQNVCLVGTSSGVGVLPIGGFVDIAVNRLLGLDGVGQMALYLVAVGVPRQFW